MDKIKLSVVAFFLSSIGFAQPYIDIAGFTYQHFDSSYKNNPDVRNHTDDYLLQLFYPKSLKNGDVFLIRFNGEWLHTTAVSDERAFSDVISTALSLGYQWVSKSKNWKTTVMVIPKLASGFEGNLGANDFQYGGLMLGNYIFSDNLNLKAGLYYNREAFGNFFVPIVGIDWKATDRLCLYGNLPSNYKIEYNAVKDRLFTGVDFKWLTRSFNLSGVATDSYMRFDEISLRAFAECFIAKNVVLSAAAGYSFGKSPQQYDTDTDEAVSGGLYSPIKNYPLFNLAIFYRIRKKSIR